MNFRYRLLGQKRRQRVRTIARRAYLLSSDPNKAQYEATQQVRQEFGGILTMILVGIAVRLAVELIKHWVSQRLSEPEPGFQSGEPGAGQ